MEIIQDLHRQANIVVQIWPTDTILHLIDALKQLPFADKFAHAEQII